MRQCLSLVGKLRYAAPCSLVQPMFGVAGKVTCPCKTWWFAHAQHVNMVVYTLQAGGQMPGLCALDWMLLHVIESRLPTRPTTYFRVGCQLQALLPARAMQVWRMATRWLERLLPLSASGRLVALLTPNANKSFHGPGIIARSCALRDSLQQRTYREVRIRFALASSASVMTVSHV